MFAYLFIFFLICLQFFVIIKENRENRRISEDEKINEQKRQEYKRQEYNRQREQQLLKERKNKVEAEKIKEQQTQEYNRQREKVLLEQQEQEIARQKLNDEQTKKLRQLQREKVVQEIEVNKSYVLISKPENMSPIDFAKIAKIEFAKFPLDIYIKANFYYCSKAVEKLAIESLDVYGDEIHFYFGSIPKTDYIEGFKHELEYYKRTPSLKKYFHYDGRWRGISFNALVSYIRHNYTNYEYLLEFVTNNEAYLTLKERVNSLIFNIFYLMTNGYLVTNTTFESSKLPENFINHWDWDADSKNQLRFN